MYKRQNLYAAKLNPDGTVPVPTLLQNYSVSVEDGSIVISWELFSVPEDFEFSILRSSDLGPTPEPIASPLIERAGNIFTFVDRSCEPGLRYSYSVLIREDGICRTLFETEEVVIPSGRVILYQNHPNPFNPKTSIGYYLPERSSVTLSIYNVSGELVRTLVNGVQEKGHHEARWDGRDERGRPMSSGVYFYTLKAHKRRITKKMVLLK